LIPLSLVLGLKYQLIIFRITSVGITQTRGYFSEANFSPKIVLRGRRHDVYGHFFRKVSEDYVFFFWAADKIPFNENAV
jgi:hypothetical protein